MWRGGADDGADGGGASGIVRRSAREDLYIDRQ